ncbi:MAG: hypothetical protein AAF532_01235 [Planctomycetota bacterium]
MGDGAAKAEVAEPAAEVSAVAAKPAARLRAEPARREEAAKPIALARRPTKERTTRVVCPMCDKAGFTAEDVSGKSVRCVDPACSVPVFVVPRTSVPTTASAPKKSSNKGAIVLAIVATTLILAGAGGLFAFLRLERDAIEQVDDGPPSPPPVRPVEPEPEPVDDEPSQPVVADTGPDLDAYEQLLDRSLERVAALPRVVKIPTLLPVLRRDAAVTLARAGRLDEADDQIDALRTLDVPYFLVEAFVARSEAEPDGAVSAVLFDEAFELMEQIPPRGRDGVAAAVSLMTSSAVRTDGPRVERLLGMMSDPEAAAHAVTRRRAAAIFDFDFVRAAASEPVGGYTDPLLVSGVWALSARDVGREEIASWGDLAAGGRPSRDLFVAQAEWLVAGGGGVEDLGAIAGPADAARLAGLARAAFVAKRAGREAATVTVAVAEAVAVFDPLVSPEEVVFDLSLEGLYRETPVGPADAVGRATAFAEAARAFAACGDAERAITAFNRAVAWARVAGPSPKTVATLTDELERDRFGVERALADAVGKRTTDERRNAANRYRRHLRDAEAAAAKRQAALYDVFEAVVAFPELHEQIGLALAEAADDRLGVGTDAWRIRAVAASAESPVADADERLPVEARLAADLAEAVGDGDGALAADLVNEVAVEAVADRAVAKQSTLAAFGLLARGDERELRAFVRGLEDPLQKAPVVEDVAARATWIGTPEAAEAFVLDRRVDPTTKFAACRGIVTATTRLLEKFRAEAAASTTD